MEEDIYKKTCGNCKKFEVCKEIHKDLSADMYACIDWIDKGYRFYS